MSSSSAAAAAATAGLAGHALCVTDRLALFMQRHALTEAKVAQQLAWPLDQLREYLAPENRKQKVALDRADAAVENLLERLQVLFARQVIANAVAKPLAPIACVARRTSTPTQFPRHASDRKSLITIEPTHPTASSSSSSSSLTSNNRKRKRRVESKQLTEVAAPARVKASSDMMCPIRIDVDVNGTRYQDTLLLNAASSALSPEAIAAQIALDERFCESMKDAISESIRRQLTTFTSFIGADISVPESLHPIYLDLLIDGLALRDQFEWDISSEFADVQAFASTLCADLNLPVPFESAIAFSICEQVAAYRRAIYAHRWIGNDPTRGKLASRTATAASGYIEAMPPVEDVFRDDEDAKLWQPALSELTREEQQLVSSRLAAARRPSSMKKPQLPQHVVNGGHLGAKRPPHKKEHKMPRPLNPFIMYCQVQKDAVNKLKPRRSASETRKIMGDMWRKMTDEDKEFYAQLAEVENEKRRREHIFELRDRAIAEWEEDEARRRGLLGASALDASTEHTRGVLLANYMNERHEVDLKRESLLAEEDAEEDE